MKKIIVLILALILTLGLVGCNGKKVNIDFPFEVEDVESVEMYHYNGAPASAEKKVVVAESDIKTLYDMFKGLSLKDKTAEETAGADVTSFRTTPTIIIPLFGRDCKDVAGAIFCRIVGKGR